MKLKPENKPLRPYFSSGPCSKRPGWKIENLSKAIIGRSHRSKIALKTINDVISLTKEILEIPEDYYVGIVPASDTGAIEMLMWSLLGKKKVEVLAWESFGLDWVKDITNQLKLLDAKITKADYGSLVNLELVDFKNDIVFTWNGTTSGVCVPNGNWIDDNREGLTICDATSAAFSMSLPWSKLDATSFSWQKVLGGEAQHGVIVLSPRTINRLENYIPDRAIPKIFQIAEKGKINKKLFTGSTINTPSMLCFEDALDALKWVKSIGGLKQTIKLSNTNLKAVESRIKNSSWLEFLSEEKSTRSCTSICLKVKNDILEKYESNELKEKMNILFSFLENENIAYDINSYRDAPLGVRIWGGATVNERDIIILLDWIEWGFFNFIKS
jgi:phosphoserine aminotransferase